MRPEFVQRSRIHATLEINHFVDRTPEFDPAPAIEFRRVGSIDPDAVIGTDEPQNEPALFLSNAKRFRATTLELLGQSITKPVAGRPENFDIVSLQADLLVQLAIHRFFRTFTG